jgi:hypothetical protein
VKRFNFFERKAMRNQAEKDLVVKLRLERTFKPEIKSLFSRMTKDFRVNVAVTGIAPDASEYSNAWQDLLRKHYNRTQQAFLGNVERQIKELTPDQTDFLQLALLDYRTNRAISQEGFITATTNTNMFLALQEARQALEEEQAEITNRTLASAAAAILARKQKGRVEGIATLETQAPAESTKLFEARSLSGMSPSPTVAPIDQVFRPTVERKLTKTWKTIGDKKVRKAPFSHVAANGQTVNIDEPYIVSGESLQYPGDNSLNASIGNTAG